MGPNIFGIMVLLAIAGYCGALKIDIEETLHMAEWLFGENFKGLSMDKHSLKEEWTELRTNGDMLIAGLQLDSFFDNGTACWDRYMNLTYVEYPEFTANMTTADVQQQVLNTSSLISNVSEHGLVCSDFLRSVYDYTEEKGAEFGSFSGYTTAFF